MSEKQLPEDWPTFAFYVAEILEAGPSRSEIGGFDGVSCWETQRNLQ